MTTTRFPAELRFNKARAELILLFDDGSVGSIPYELLRIESPSAETKGHGAETPPPPIKKRTAKRRPLTGPAFFVRGFRPPRRFFPESSGPWHGRPYQWFRSAPSVPGLLCDPGLGGVNRPPPSQSSHRIKI